MKRLAIDTSTEVASVALMDGEQVFYQEQTNLRTQAQHLLPMIAQLMNQANLTMEQLDGIVFGCGPGSFTGLRIACSVAKGLAYAHNIQLYPVSSLATIAWGVRQSTEFKDASVLAVLDARMQEMYWGYFAEHVFVAPDQISSVSQIAPPTKAPIVLAGVGIDLYWQDFPEHIKSQIKTKLTLAPNAADMLGLVRHVPIKPVSAAEAEPIYVRNQVTQGSPHG